MSSRTPHRFGPSASATSSAVRTESFSKSTSTVTFISSRVAAGERARRRDRVAAVGGDQRVRHRADAAAAPPRGLRVGGHADRARDVRGPAVAGLHEPVVVAGGEVQDRLAAGRVHDLAHVAHDQRAPRQAAEVDGLEVGEQRVVALDRHHRLPRRDLVALVQRAHLELVPARIQSPSGARRPEHCEHRDRLVDAAEHRGSFWKTCMTTCGWWPSLLEQPLGVVEVRVGVVAVADPLDGQAED